MNVSLPQTWEEFVAGQVSSGEFGNASEVVREALRLLEEQDQLRSNRLETLRKAIDDGIKSGPCRKATADQVIKRARAKKLNKR